jgi:hypothetical protein
VLNGRTLFIALGLVSAGVASSAPAVEPPRIRKPVRAPADLPSNVLPLPPAALDNTLTIAGDDIKARKIDSRLSVYVLINSRGPYRFVVDSGADSSAVGLRIAQQLELPLGRPAILNGTTSRDIVDRVKIDSMTVGPTTIRNLELPALRESDLGGDGLIGIDGLSQQRLMMDYDKRLIKIEDARIPVKHTPGEIVIIARRKRGQLIMTNVQASGLALDAVIDTGSEVTIGNLALRDKLLRKHRDDFYEVAATGVTGVTVKLQMARIDHLQLGPITLTDVPIAFADIPPFKAFGMSNGPALLLGSDLMENFRRVSLDFKSRKIRFQLRRCRPEGVMISTSPTHALTRMSSNGGPDVCG